MPWSIVELYGALPAFVLVLARVAGLMLSAPFFSGEIVPMQIKALLAGAISLAVFPMLAARMTMPVTLSGAMAGLLGELAIGLLIGFMVSLVLAGVQLGIQLASQQAGLALGEVFNPMLDASVPVIAELYYFVAIAIFLLVNGHHAIVRALLDSFESIPPLSFQLTDGIVRLLVDVLTVSLAVAIRVAGPMILALLLGFLTLGFISRTLPQLNILTVGFPIKIALALLIMALTMMTLEPVILDAVSGTMEAVRAELGMGV